MSPTMVADICHEAIMLTLHIALPLLLTALIIGIVISLIQAITQIQEQTLTFIPKIIGICAAMFIFGAYISNGLMSFTQQIFTLIKQIK
jgi:flagellar biosynthetic protein FliQ